MNLKLPLFALGAALVAGCSTFATFGMVQSTFTNIVVTRAITILPPGQAQLVTAIVGWNPIGGAVDKITREQGGPLTSKYEFKGSEITSPLLKDSSVSADVTYKYTLFAGTATRSNTIKPVAAPVESVILASPGKGITELSGNTANAPVDIAKPAFTWSKLVREDASASYGLYLLILDAKKITSGEMDVKYSTFLEEASHSSGVAYAVKSDLTGFSTDLLGFLKSVPALGFLSPKDTKANGLPDQLPAGEYAWTVLTVNADSRRIAFGIGKVSSPSDKKHYLFFKVP